MRFCRGIRRFATGCRLEREMPVRAVTGAGISLRHLPRYLRERYLPLCEVAVTGSRNAHAFRYGQVTR